MVGLMSRTRCEAVISLPVDLGYDPENGQPLIHEAALGQHRDHQAALREFLEEKSSVAEGGQQHQRRSTGLEPCAEAGRKPLRYVARAPRPVSVVPGRAAQERWVEQNEIETLAGYGREQIAEPHLDLVLQMIEVRVDGGAANR